jgi:hypothetical protein
MDSPESPDYQQEISDLEAMLDDLPVEQRGVVMQRLRDAIGSTGEPMSAEDENLCDRFAQGAADIRQVYRHFGGRLWQAFGARPDSEEEPGPSIDAPGTDTRP